MEVQVKMEGIKELMADVKASGGNANRLVNAAITNGVTRTQSEIRSRAAHRTGTLQRGVAARVKDLTGTVEETEKYGPFLEYGTGIYGPDHTEIRPTTAKVLAFKVGGSMVFAKMVKGIKAQPFFFPGANAAQGYVLSQFDKATEILLRGLAGRGFK